LIFINTAVGAQGARVVASRPVSLRPIQGRAH